MICCRGVLFGAFILCSSILTVARFSHLFCIQGASLLIAMLAPWVANIVTTSGLNPFPHLDLTPFAFLISSLIFAQSLVLFRLLDIVPVAREMVIESMREAAIVLDAHNRVMDLNSAARRLVNFRASKAVGQPFAQVFSTWPELVERCCNAVEVNEAVILGGDESKDATLRYFGLRISPLYRRSEHLAVTGRLIVLNDITERIQAERALK